MRVSIIVPTLNEEAGIAAFLDALVPLRAYEVIVADGGSADQTREIAAAHGARVVTSPPGRGPQMNRGAAMAQGDVFLFLHADVRLQATALLAIEAALANPRLDGGIFDVHFDGNDWVAQTFYWIYHWRRYLGIFYGDAGIFVRREAFARLGGFRNYPIVEDYEFGRRLFGWGGRMAFLAEPIRVSDRRWRQAGLARTLWTWVVIQTLYSLGISPERLGPIYRQIR